MGNISAAESKDNTGGLLAFGPLLAFFLEHSFYRSEAVRIHVIATGKNYKWKNYFKETWHTSIDSI